MIYLLDLLHSKEQVEVETPWFIQPSPPEARKNASDNSYRRTKKVVKAVELFYEAAGVDAANWKDPEFEVKQCLCDGSCTILDMGDDGLICFVYPNLIYKKGMVDDVMYTFQSTTGKLFKVIRLTYWGDGDLDETEKVEDNVQGYCQIPDGIYLIPVEKYKDPLGRERCIYPDWEGKHELVPSWLYKNEMAWVHHETIVNSDGLDACHH